ncbi:FmdB family transcriptional regulator [Rugosibacter aromaticivorans]|uniref:FmdB family transcriptional regulator n=1 Tax=Rugosibacter aromaticivorans TaxID=1565605 RepID=A0A0C5J6P1_9PROT|nr:zinc ribbon domain-containing protein [Rugosibacter aromaticivorans]AJP47393.1 FmdB family transcriptional regulator [Rugosibacter aromaticivorans]TBR13875.1 MAG: zinc ribbon domain-containing protein [Rugosibacter sp.]
MPIYAYRCTQCGFEKEFMQKISDPLLTLCPQCQSESLAKQLTAPGFQLKGSGWYATDFKGGPAGKPAVITETTSETRAETKIETKAAPATATPASKSESASTKA